MLTLMLSLSIVGYYYQKYVTDASVVKVKEEVKDQQYKFVLEVEESENFGE